MTKDLSKQICEKCGIEYTKKYSYFVKKYPDREYSEAVLNEVDGVLDFGQPENFVKLYELQIKELYMSIGFMLHKIFRIGNRIDFLTCLNLALHEKSVQFGKNRKLKIIKQSIRDAEWKYE